MKMIEKFEATIKANNELIERLQEQNKKMTAWIEKMTALKPKKENFGWVDADGFESEGSWAYDGCEEAYFEAMQKWEELCDGK